MKKLLNLSLLSIVLLWGVQLQAQSCNERCLVDIAEQYLEDVQTQDYTGLPWARQVSYTENNVAMMIGDGFWGAGPGVEPGGLFVADASNGNVVWLGVTTEHGQAAYHGLRLKVEERKISQVESYLGREGQPDLFAPTDNYSVPAVFSDNVPRGNRLEREKLIAIVDGYFNSKQLNDGAVYTDFTEDCVRVTNGVNVTHGEGGLAALVQGCRGQLEEGLYKPVDRIRARRYPVVDQSKGIVVALSIEDHAVRYVDYQTRSGVPVKVDVEYPNARGMLEIFKIENGSIARIEGVSVFLPYYIPSLWRD